MLKTQFLRYSVAPPIPPRVGCGQRSQRKTGLLQGRGPRDRKASRTKRSKASCLATRGSLLPLVSSLGKVSNEPLWRKRAKRAGRAKRAARTNKFIENQKKLVENLQEATGVSRRLTGTSRRPQEAPAVSANPISGRPKPDRRKTGKYTAFCRNEIYNQI